MGPRSRRIGGGAAPPHPGPPTRALEQEPDSVAGLTSTVAAERLSADGPNAIVGPSRPQHWRRLLAQFVHLFALLLWSGAALALLGGLPELSAAIVAVIAINAVFAFVQEHRAERATDALRLLLPLLARVRRDGVVVEDHHG